MNMINDTALAALEPYVSQSELISLFGQRGDIVVGGSFGRATTGQDFDSEASLANNGSWAKDIVYDPEAWAATPKAEQQDPGYYADLAATIAKEGHQNLVVTPSTDLVTGPPGTVYAAFLASDIVQTTALHANTFVIQAQGSEVAPQTYANFVQSVVAEVHSVNPHETVLATLSSYPSGQTPTTAELEQCVTLTKGMVSGYEIDIPNGVNATGMVPFLNWMHA